MKGDKGENLPLPALHIKYISNIVPSQVLLIPMLHSSDNHHAMKHIQQDQNSEMEMCYQNHLFSLHEQTELSCSSFYIVLCICDLHYWYENLYFVTANENISH